MTSAMNKTWAGPVSSLYNYNENTRLSSDLCLFFRIHSVDANQGSS
jgi:hypothetical protein